MVGHSQGEIQVFDMALSPIKMQLLAEDLSPKSTLPFSKHFNVSSSLSQIQWAAPRTSYQSMADTDIHDLLLLRFDQGPVGVLHFKTGKLITVTDRPETTPIHHNAILSLLLLLSPRT